MQQRFATDATNMTTTDGLTECLAVVTASGTPLGDGPRRGADDRHGERREEGQWTPSS